MLEIKELTKKYDTVTAVDAVSFRIADLESVSIRGESGCGKSTLLALLAGLLTPDRGEILRDGKPLPGDPHRREIAQVFQDGLLWNHMTVEENILFGSPLKDSKERHRRVQELAERYGIGDLLGRYPDKISGGQARRAALARAFACEKKLILLDEPFSNLDKESRRKAMEATLALSKGKCAILLVTHSKEEAEAICTRHLRMEDGKLYE